MDTSSILAILGFIASVLLGALSIYLFFWGRRYPGRLTFVKENCIGLFDALVRNLSGLQITFEQQPIGQNLVLLKGYILNTGVKDISQEMVDERLALTVPDGFRWVSAQVVSASPGITASIDLSDVRRMVFFTSLFRCDEHVCFEALAEVPAGDGKKDGRAKPDELLEKYMSFEHRIADTQKVDQQEIQSDSQAKRHKRLLYLSITQIAVGFVGLVGGLVFDWMRHGGLPADLHYRIQNEDGELIEVELSPAIGGYTMVRGVDNEYEDRVEVDKFFKNKMPEPIVVSKRETVAIAIGFVLCIILFMLPLTYVLRQRQKDKKLKRLLEFDQTSSD